MPTIKTITAAGKRVTKKKIILIQQTINAFPALSLREMGNTICELLNWLTPNGKPQIQTCLTLLDVMEKDNLITLPAKAPHKPRREKIIEHTEQSDEVAKITGDLKQFTPLRLEVVNDKKDTTLWNELVDRHHYLGYKKPMGTHLRYFLLDQDETKLGCLLFSFATWSLPCRDQWLGWDKPTREKHIKLIVNNNRFLIFPWVEIKNLASKTLSMAAQQIADDWKNHHGYRPVLLETFTDPTQFKGTCYRAANWEQIGKTKAYKHKPAKEVFVYPLTSDYKVTLIQGSKSETKKKPSQRQNTSASKSAPDPLFDNDTLETNDPFVLWWQKVLTIVIQVSNDFDQQWQIRRRTLDSLLLVLFIFRLVFSKNKQSYTTTIAELWSQCQSMQVPLPQQKPVVASAFCNARAKLDENIFKQINTEIIHVYDTEQKSNHQWRGHRLFAVDGSKINLPRTLIPCGYRTPSDNAYYPQGLVSCLYQLKAKIPTDFILTAHSDERKAAQTHFQALQQGDIVIYDRGYFSYAMFYFHLSQNTHAIFRLRTNITPVIDNFINSDETDSTIEYIPSKAQQVEIHSNHPSIKFKPLKLRLIKYQVSGTSYYLATTLLDNQQYPAAEFSDLYHARWGVEELYKISKVLIDVEDFHGKTERGVKQELYAHFVLVTLARLFSNHAEAGFEETTSKDKSQPFKVNFKNCLITIARNLEALFLDQAIQVKNTLNKIITTIGTCRQRVRPNRSYDRRSRKPAGKWPPPKGSKAEQTIEV